ncbi:MAG: chromosome partitioning protein ParB, partial [Bacteroidales bacterium]|nr:chromosome partitioning protein ParB [Bacteroidales bacterium]
LKLPAEVQIGLRDKTIDMGHARALLSVEDASVQLELYKAIVAEGLSVRKVEELARTMAQAPAKAAQKVARSSAQRQEYNLLRNHLSNFFGLKVQFSCDDKGKGKISIPFKNEDELERIIGLLDKLK